MNAVLAGLLLLVTAQVPAGGTDAQPKPTVSAELWFVTFERGIDPDKLPFDPREAARLLRGSGPDEKGRMPTWGLASQLGQSELSVKANGHTLAFDAGKLVTRSAGDSRDSKPPWEVFAAPRVMIALGQMAEVRVGRSVPYLVAAEGDCFKVEQRADLIEGVSLELTAVRADERGVRFENIDLRVSRVVGRQPLPGLALEVGPPIIDTRHTTLNISVDTGKVGIIPLPQNNQDAPILVFITARLAPGP